MSHPSFRFVFFFNLTATTQIYTLSLHDALPIFWSANKALSPKFNAIAVCRCFMTDAVWDCDIASIRDCVTALNSFPCGIDRKSTRLNSSHTVISYAVFCLKKKTALRTAWQRDCG